MSFIYVTKQKNNSILVFSDTKISDSFKTVSKLLWSDTTNKLVNQFGMIKSIIISKNYCISFAGNIAKANELLSQVNKTPLEELLKIALSIHTKSLELPIEEQIDFIICYQNINIQQIFEIKDGYCNEVNTSWIGSGKAFNYLQDIKLNKKSTIINKNIPQLLEISTSSGNDEEFDNYLDLFYKIIHDSGDSSVGGFVVAVKYDSNKNSFHYAHYIKTHHREIINGNQVTIPMYQPASTGGFTILMYKSYSIVALYLLQNNLGIIYNHYRNDENDYLNKNTKSLFLPNISKINQIDFYIQLGDKNITPPGFFGCDPKNIDYIYSRINIFKDKPSMALLYINKAIEEIIRLDIHKDKISELEHMKNNIIGKDINK